MSTENPPPTMKATTIPCPPTYIPPDISTISFSPSFPTPTPTSTKLLIRIHAVAITPQELSWPTLAYAVSKPRIPCHDIAGTVFSSPPGSKFKPGDRVFGLLDLKNQGGMAEYTVADENLIAKIPEGLSFEEAASVPRASLTAWQGPEWVKEGMRIFVTGASGAVGRMGVQIARLRVGESGGVVALGGKGVEGLKELGADLCVSYRESENWDEVVGKEGLLDGVFDCVGGETLERAEKLVKKGGWVVSVASPPPRWANRTEEGWEVVEENNLKKYFFIVEESGEQLEEIGKLVQAGKIKPSVAFVAEGLTLEDVRDAWSRGLRGGLAGSAVVKVL